MPNHFKKNQPPITSVVTRPDQLNLPQPMSQEPGWFASRRIKKEADRATVNIAVGKIQSFEQEITAIDAVAAAMAGQEVRAELGRVHATVLGTISAELLKDHQAVGLELMGVRFAGSVVNLEALAQRKIEIRTLLEKGEITEEDAVALLATAKDLQIELEGDIDEQFRKSKESVHESFNLATDPSRTILNRIKNN